MARAPISPIILVLASRTLAPPPFLSSCRVLMRTIQRKARIDMGRALQFPDLIATKLLVSFLLLRQSYEIGPLPIPLLNFLPLLYFDRQLIFLSHTGPPLSNSPSPPTSAANSFTNRPSPLSAPSAILPCMVPPPVNSSFRSSPSFLLIYPLRFFLPRWIISSLFRQVQYSSEYPRYASPFLLLCREAPDLRKTLSFQRAADVFHGPCFPRRRGEEEGVLVSCLSPIL